MDKSINYVGADEAKLYLQAIIAVSKADGKLDEKEKEYIEMQSDLLSINPEEYFSKEIDIKSIDFSYMSKLTKISIIRDCIVLANIDSEYTDSERKKIEEIADVMGIDKKKVNETEQWLKEYWAIIEKGKNLFE